MTLGAFLFLNDPQVRVTCLNKQIKKHFKPVRNKNLEQKVWQLGRKMTQDFCTELWPSPKASSPSASSRRWRPEPSPRCRLLHTRAPGRCRGAAACTAGELWTEAAATSQTPGGEGRPLRIRTRAGNRTARGRSDSDLHRVKEGAKFSQQRLPHVVAAARVGQHQHRSPAAAAGRPQLQNNTQQFLVSRKTPSGARGGGGAGEAVTLVNSSGCWRRSLFTWYR